MVTTLLPCFLIRLGSTLGNILKEFILWLATVYTQDGEEAVTDLVGVGGYFIGWGTGVVAADKADADLGTASAEARVAGVETQPLADKLQWVETITSASGQTITEVGLFDGAGAGGVPTYNAVAMTDSGEGVIHSGSEVRVELFYLVNPAGGSNTLSIPNTGTLDIVPIASAWSGVDTGDPLDVTNNAFNPDSANPSVNITTGAANKLIIDVMMNGHFQIPSANSHTLISSQQNGSWDSNAQYTLDDGSAGITLDYTMNADDWVMIVASFNPSNGGPTTFYQTANATAIGVGVVATVASFFRTLAATATGVGVVNTVATFARTLAATAVGNPVVNTITTFSRTFAATATGVAVTSRVATFYRTFNATATGVGVVTKKMFKTIAATAIGIAVTTQGIVGAVTYYVTAAATAVGVGFVSLKFIDQFIRSKFKKATGRNAFFGTIRRMGEANKKDSTGKPGVLQSILRKLGGDE